MSNNDWVQQGTPREADDWGQEQDDYGVPVETAEWDDYSSEQTVPVPTPHHPEPEAVVEEPSVAEPAVEEFVAVSGSVAEAPAFEEAPVEEAPAEAVAVEVSEPVADEAPVEETVEVSDPVVEAPAFEEAPVEESPVEEAPVEESPVEEAPGEESADGSPATQEDPDRTAVHAAFVASDVEAAAAEGATASIAGLYREDANERTQVIDTDAALAAEAAEEAQREEQLRLEREARAQRLGMVATSDANALREPHPPRPGLSGFGSFGALVLRLVLTFVLGVAAWQILGDIDATANYLGQTVLPYPREIAWGLGFTLAALAVMFLLGFGVRVAGFLLAAIAGCALAFLRWGPFPIFVEGLDGFRGDKELVLAAVGVLLFSIGGGKVGIDGAISTARWNAKLAKRS